MTPYGELQASGDIAIENRENIRADLVLSDTRLSKDDISIEASGPLKLTLIDGIADVNFDISVPFLAYGKRSLNQVSLNGQLQADVNQRPVIFDTDTRLKFSDLKTRRFEAGNGQINWDGEINLGENNRDITANGDWAIDVADITVADQEMRQTLASQLSLSETLSATPIAAGFSSGLENMVSALLERSTLSGAGTILYGQDHIHIDLLDDVSFGSFETKLTISPAGGVAIYDFDRQSQQLSARTSLSLIGQYPMDVDDLSLSVSTPDGLAINQVDSLSATLERNTQWEAQFEGRPVRLGAGQLTVNYNASAKRNLQVKGPLDFDGPLPGAWVSGLQTTGLLGVALSGEQMQVYYSPEENKPIRLQSLETVTGWRAETFDFNLVDTKRPLYMRYPAGSKTFAQLRDASAVILDPTASKSLNVRFAALDVLGDMTSSAQNWMIEVKDADVKTDDYIGENTVMSTPSAELTAKITTQNPIDISLQTQSANVTTPLLKAQNIPLTLFGTPERFTIDYGSNTRQGLIEMQDGSLPPLPLRGSLVFENQTFTGSAQTVLPKAEDTEIDVSYVFKDGAGTAKVIIPELKFERGKLQPQDLAKAFQGKIADVNGTVSAAIDLAFEAGKPLQSSGRARLRNLDFGTLPGPFSGVSTDIEFDSVFPLVTLGRQRLTVSSFNPGLALDDGVIDYELVDGGVKIHSAVWPLVNGTIEIEPTLWRYNAEKNRVVLKINDVSVGAFLGDVGGGNLTATGDVVGIIPVLVEGVSVSIDGGLLAVEDGGVIQYRSPPLVSPVDLIPNEFVTLKDYRQFQDMRNNPDPESNVGKDLAFTTLRNFEYKSLSAKLNGPLDGEVEVNLKFEGRNPKILAGTRFAFNVTVIGELVNLARNLKIDGSFDKIRGYLELDEASNTSLETTDIEIP